MIEGEITDVAWTELVDQARKAAGRGEKQYLLLRFPSELCTDDARAINNPPNSHVAPNPSRRSGGHLRAVAFHTSASRIQPLGSGP